MKVIELIGALKAFNPEALVDVVVYNRSEGFSLAWGSSEGVTKLTCENVSICVDRICQDEEEG